MAELCFAGTGDQESRAAVSRAFFARVSPSIEGWNFGCDEADATFDRALKKVASAPPA
jgi:hypothetical protein